MSKKQPESGNLEGLTFGNLTVLRWARGSKHGAVWLCRCSCGTESEVEARTIRNAKIAGCRACAASRQAKSMTTHGESYGANKPGTRLYRIYRAMLARCTTGNSQNKGVYQRFGIRVCPEWGSFEAFRDWALANGYTDEMTIDRQDRYAGYNPANCVWTSKSENSRRAGQVTNAYMAFAALTGPRRLSFEYTPPEMFGLL